MEITHLMTPFFSINNKKGSGDTYWGKYIVTFFGKDSLSVTVIEDSCTGRRESLNGTGIRRGRK